MIRIGELNGRDLAGFVAVCGPLFEHSPWVAERAWRRRPLGSVETLHEALVEAMWAASETEKLALLRAHPDLVGRFAREGKLTRASTAEQAAAGLIALTDDEVKAFDRYNEAYREKFGFPFVICARENKKDAILAAFPVRLANSREREMETALGEVAKIARLRLLDVISE